MGDIVGALVFVADGDTREAVAAGDVMGLNTTVNETAEGTFSGDALGGNVADGRLQAMIANRSSIPKDEKLAIELCILPPVNSP